MPQTRPNKPNIMDETEEQAERTGEDGLGSNFPYPLLLYYLWVSIDGSIGNAEGLGTNITRISHNYDFIP